jgi:anti-sigma factor RsiW
MTNQDARGQSDIEELLPWHAAGTLSPREAADVEAAMSRDPELMRRYMLACEEMAATVELNESLGQPSPRAMQRLFAAIDAEGGHKVARSAGIVGRIGEFIASLTPRQLAFSAAAAAVAILLQAGLIGSMVIGERSQSAYRLASAEKVTPASGYALVRFAQTASAGEISSLLAANRATIVDGPRPGGLYRVRIAALEQDNTTYRGVGKPPTETEHRDQVIANLRSANSIVQFAVPAQ